MPSRRLPLNKIPEAERPREKMMVRGEGALSDAELLSIVLVTGNRAETALQLAQRILQKAGNLKTLAAMSLAELQEIDGIGPAKATQLKAALELARRRQETISRPRFSSSRAVFAHYEPQFREKRQEEFWVIAVDTKNRLQFQDGISKGTLMGSLVHPREVFHPAIKNSAAGIIVLHNHPSGDPEPSAEDRKATAQLAEAGRLLGIPLLDHVIIGNGRYFSFKDAGLL
jgi:DNA repair protein RadC